MLDNPEFGCDLDAVPDCTGNGAIVRVQLVRAFSDRALSGIHFELISDINPADHHHFVFGFDLTDRGGREETLASRNSARLQRASQGASQSTCCSRNHIIQGRRMGLNRVHIDAISIGDFRVNAEIHRIWLYGQIGSPQRSLHAFDPHFRSVYNCFRHVEPPQYIGPQLSAAGSD